MEIKSRDDGKKGQFYVEVDGAIVAEMTYVWAGEGKIIIDHTQVDESLKGKSVGKQLVDRAVRFAREKNLKILPLCPFTKAVIDKTPAYQDVLF